MSKFKVGDKVRVVKKVYKTHDVGDIGTVNYVDVTETDYPCMVEVNGVNLWFHKDWMELVKSKKHGKFETMAMMSEWFDFGIDVEGTEVLVYIRRSYDDDDAFETTTFDCCVGTTMAEGYNRAYKWLVKKACKLSKEFEGWYNE